MSKEFVIYRQEGGKKMYLTNLPDDDYPLGSIGFQSSQDGVVPKSAGSCPTEEDAKKVIDYLRQQIGTNFNRFGFEEREAV